MVHIVYTKIEEEIPDNIWQVYLRQIPVSMQERNQRFLRWQDRHANLMGKIILIEAIRHYGLSADCLQNISYNAYGKPSLEGLVEFNISHSGEYVICAVSKEIKLGIDIEQIKPTNLSDFKAVMTSMQWDEIERSENILKKFYSYWVTKESVIKADSRGLSIPLEDIEIFSDRATILSSNQAWFTRQLKVDDNYCAVLATDTFISDLQIQMRYFPIISSCDHK